MNVLSSLLQHQVVAIIRGAKPADVLQIAQALYDGGVKLMEVTLNSPNALGVIEQLSHQMKDKMMIGAGTVLDSAAARDAIAAGARFIISPTFDKGTIRTTRRYGAVSIPGAYTPTEILQAYTYGGEIIKVFPASSPGYIKDIGGPLPQIPLMPTGGINKDNISAFKKAGGVAFGIASALVDTKQPITESYLLSLTENAKELSKAVSIQIIK